MDHLFDDPDALPAVAAVRVDLERPLPKIVKSAKSARSSKTDSEATASTAKVTSSTKNKVLETTAIRAKKLEPAPTAKASTASTTTTRPSRAPKAIAARSSKKMSLPPSPVSEPLDAESLTRALEVARKETDQYRAQLDAAHKELAVARGELEAMQKALEEAQRKHDLFEVKYALTKAAIGMKTVRGGARTVVPKSQALDGGVGAAGATRDAGAIEAAERAKDKMWTMIRAKDAELAKLRAEVEELKAIKTPVKAMPVTQDEKDKMILQLQQTINLNKL